MKNVSSRKTHIEKKRKELRPVKKDAYLSFGDLGRENIVAHGDRVTDFSSMYFTFSYLIFIFLQI